MPTPSINPDDIKDLAKLFFMPVEIALILEAEAIDEFVAKCTLLTTPEGRAYHTGRLQSEKELRESIIRLAKQGSSPAQTAAMDLLKDSKLKSLDR